MTTRRVLTLEEYTAVSRAAERAFGIAADGPDVTAFVNALQEQGYPVTFGPGCSEYDHPLGCQCPYPVAAAERDRLAELVP